MGNDFPCDAFAFVRMGIDILSMELRDTIYWVNVSDTGAKNESVMHLFATDDISAKPVGRAPFLSLPGGCVSTMSGTHPFPTKCYWEDDITFNPYVGVPTVVLLCQLAFLPSNEEPPQDYSVGSDAALVIETFTNVYTISSFLRSLLAGSKERLYLCFRNQRGTLLGASHGKFYSHSDVVCLRHHNRRAFFFRPGIPAPPHSGRCTPPSDSPAEGP